MKNSRRLILFISLAVTALLIYIMMESFSQPGMERFKGKYEEIDFYRNENNTGPVLRIYAVRVLDTDPSWMKEFGEAQPHTKYGKTKVFFFKDIPSESLTLTPKEPHFPKEWEKYLLASYEKSILGESRFTFNDND
ncbi:MAG: hypothetical protein HLUCCX10_10320 [Algoriphagus marincola HL-49]|uniref:Uncharacterized protein n=1 Tax=Algoriphagus marincola HL-49 TaxID=1305737 RepID=A0A0P8A9Y7_9BACT|nr:MAG: hypothetical protein HLUCCX10_10320 [Algoriphagus marincola HL-49]